MTANCSRFWGLQSTLAPTSSRTQGDPESVGMTTARAGRSTPGSAPRTILAVAMAAPVLPAVKNPAARFSLTSLRPTRMELLRLERTAWAAFSSMVMYSSVWTMSMGRRAPNMWWARACWRRGRRRGSGPMRWTRTLRLRQARMAPRISGSGALSEPMASRAMSVSMTERGAGDRMQGVGDHGMPTLSLAGANDEGWGTRSSVALAGLFDFEDFAAFVGSAFGAGAVGQLALVAVGALGESGGGDGVVGAAGGSAPFGVAALWIRHNRFLSAAGALGPVWQRRRAGPAKTW